MSLAGQTNIQCTIPSCDSVPIHVHVTHSDFLAME